MQPADDAVGTTVKGQFTTNGRVFIFSLPDVPISGVGDTPNAAYESLTQAIAAAGDLPAALRRISEDQRQEASVQSLARWTAGGLIAIGIIGGTIAAGFAIAPAILTDIAETGLQKSKPSDPPNAPPGKEGPPARSP